MVLLWEMTTRWQHVFMPNSGYSGTRALGKVLFLHCLLEWNVPEQTPKAVSHSFFLPYPCLLDTSQFLQHHFVERAFTHSLGNP